MYRFISIFLSLSFAFLNTGNATSSLSDSTMTVTYTSVVKSHVEQFSREAVYKPGMSALGGSVHFTRKGAPLATKSYISGTGGLLDDSNYSWLKGVTFSDASSVNAKRSRVQVRFYDPSGGRSPGYLTLIRRSDYDAINGVVTKKPHKVWEAPLEMVRQDEISKMNGEQNYYLTVSHAIKSRFAEDAGYYMSQVLKPQIEAACNYLCVAELVSTDVKGLDSKVKVSVYKDSVNPVRHTALIDWNDYSISFKFNIRLKTTEDLAREGRGV